MHFVSIIKANYLKFRGWEHIPEPERLISSTSDDCLKEKECLTVEEYATKGSYNFKIEEEREGFTCPSGEIAKYKTLYEWPVSVASYKRT